MQLGFGEVLRYSVALDWTNPALAHHVRIQEHRKLAHTEAKLSCEETFMKHVYSISQPSRNELANEYKHNLFHVVRDASPGWNSVLPVSRCW